MVVVWLFSSETTAQVILPAQILGWLVPGDNLLIHFPALTLNQINYFNFAKQASCWSLGCHSAALFLSPQKIKYCFCFSHHPLRDLYHLFLLLPKAATEERRKLLPWPSGQPWPPVGLSTRFQPVLFCLPGCLFLRPCRAPSSDLFSLWGNESSNWFFSGQQLFLHPAATVLTKFWYSRQDKSVSSIMRRVLLAFFFLSGGCNYFVFLHCLKCPVK